MFEFCIHTVKFTVSKLTVKGKYSHYYLTCLEFFFSKTVIEIADYGPKRTVIVLAVYVSSTEAPKLLNRF